MNVTDPALNDSLCLLGLGTAAPLNSVPTEGGPAVGVAGADTIKVTNDGSQRVKSPLLELRRG